MCMRVAVNQAAERVDVPSRTPRYYDPTGRVAADQRSGEAYPVYGARDVGVLSRRQPVNPNSCRGRSFLLTRSSSRTVSHQKARTENALPMWM